MSDDPDSTIDAADDTQELSQVSNAESFSPPGLATDAAAVADAETAVEDSSKLLARRKPRPRILQYRTTVRTKAVRESYL